MKIRTLLTTTSAILFMAGCATTPEATPETPEILTIQVQNFSGGMSEVQVHLVSAVNGRQFIGTLPKGEGGADFDVQEPLVLAEYRLEAEAPNGEVIASRPFVLQGPGVRWNVTTNTIVPLGERVL